MSDVEIVREGGRHLLANPAMQHRERFIIRRDTGVISLDEWTAYIASSPVLKTMPRREGINPFTKETILFHPSPGAANFESAGGRGSIGFRDGALIASVPEAGESVVAEIARALGAVVERVGRGDPP
jgi:hypothetical protein